MGDTYNAANNNPGMEAMAAATSQAAMYQSNAMVASAGLQAATQMYQANLMYLTQHEGTEAKLEIAHMQNAQRNYETQMDHDEKVRELYIDYRRMLADTKQDVNAEPANAQSLYNPANSPQPPSSVYEEGEAAETGIDNALDQVKDIVEDGTA